MIKDDNSYINKGPCSNPECGSSDACAVYTDGHTHCFSCGHHTGPDGETHVAPAAPADFSPLIGETVSLTKRRISENTCRKFGYFTTTMPKLGPVQVANFYGKNRLLVAQHIRGEGKQFRWRGAANKAGLFGQHAWASGQKRVVITEGELDAMSLSEAMGNSWPVVSIPNGATAAKKSLAQELEWLESFGEIVLCFDNDDPGRKAAAECAELFTPGKCKIASLPLKDASDMWVAGRGKELTQAVMFQAQEFRPDGIICGTDPKVRDYVVNFEPHADAHYPWPKLDERLYGMRRGEIVIHTAGTGIGKSTICREIGYDLGVKQDQKVGIIALEENVGRTGLHLASIAANKRLHLRGILDREERERLYAASVGNGNFFLYDHFGSLESANLLSKLRYMVKGCGCNWIILDHISIAVSGLEIDDERKALDVLMTNLRSLVEEVHCGMHVICHLSKPKDGKAHEEGARISLNNLRGSHGIAQLADITLGYERNQQDENHSNRITVRDLKDRYSGETGVKSILEYNKDTGRVEEVDEDAAVFSKEEPAGGSHEDF